MEWISWEIRWETAAKGLVFFYLVQHQTLVLEKNDFESDSNQHPSSKMLIMTMGSFHSCGQRPISMIVSTNKTTICLYLSLLVA